MRWRPEAPSGGGRCWGSRSVCERGERERQPTDPPERSLPRAPRRPGGVGGEAPAAQARYDPRRNRPRDQARAARAGRRRRPRAARVRGLAAATVFRGGPGRGWSAGDGVVDLRGMASGTGCGLVPGLARPRRTVGRRARWSGGARANRYARVELEGLARGNTCTAARAYGSRQFSGGPPWRWWPAAAAGAAAARRRPPAAPRRPGL